MKKYISIRNLKFMLHEFLDLEKIKQLPKFQEYDDDTFGMILDMAKDIGDNHLYPIFSEMDKKKSYYDEKEGVVKVHPKLCEVIKILGEGGWICSYADYEEGGQQMPHVLLNAGRLILHAANANAVAYTLLTDGSANLIRSFGSAEQKAYYVPNMINGTWQGTMALTEPQAGSSLSDVKTSATPQADGSYHIAGQKIYITGGDYEGVENIIHLTLARIDGAPAGTKGISLFIVPKHREEDGRLVPNDVNTAGLYGKMGQKGTVAAHLSFGDHNNCKGYLVGQANRGLKYMFQMMNEARIGTGAMATASASAAYYASLQYANERPQGRHPSNRDLNAPQVLIIEHADVRRMLLFQKAIVEGSIALVETCAYYADIVENTTGEERDNIHLLLELLTPLAKSFAGEWCNLSTSAGIQVLGGAGFTDDFPLEQYYRDVRIASIYEGTTTIHGMDILGRKVTMQNGKAMQLLAAEFTKTIQAASAIKNLQPFAAKLGEAAQNLQKTTMHLLQLAGKDKPEVFLADATLYLDFFGIVTVAWLWLKQGMIAQKALDKGAIGDDYNFYQGKVHTMQYYFEYEVPKTKGLQERLTSDNKLTVNLESAYLN